DFRDHRVRHAQPHQLPNAHDAQRVQPRQRMTLAPPYRDRPPRLPQRRTVPRPARNVLTRVSTAQPHHVRRRDPVLLRDLRDRLLRGRVQRTDLVHFLMGQRLRPPPLRRTLRTLQGTGEVRVSRPVDARLDRLLRDTELLGELAAGRLPRPYLLATVSHMFCEHALSHWRRATEL